MPRNLTKVAQILEKEILRSAAGLDDIKSMVVDSTKITEWPAASGRYIAEAGEVMGKVSGGSKIMPIRMGLFGTGAAGAWVQADIVGILASAREFFLGPGVTAGAVTDEEVAILHLGCDFNVAKLLGYTGNETMVKAALPLCMFR